MSLSRRDFVAGSTLLLGAWGASPKAQAKATARIGAIEHPLGGRIGVSALNTANGARIRHRADERFAMCSTFKAVLAAAVLAQVDRGALRLDQPVPYGKSDLRPHAPVTEPHVSEGAMSVEALCAAAVQVSDNTAANLLLTLIGGPASVTAFFRAAGDAVSRLDRMELELNSNLRDDPRDTTTPDAMAGTLKRLLLDGQGSDAPVLTDASRARLTGWMLGLKTGEGRIRAGLPPDWRVADKTGTSNTGPKLWGAINDIAVVWPPSHGPIVLTVYTDVLGGTVEKCESAIAEVARVVAGAFG